MGQYVKRLPYFNYRSKDGQSTKIFDALDWLAHLMPHIPNKGEQKDKF